jgi:hypothetical protein
VEKVYSIPCECGKAYVGQKSRSTETRRKEHTSYLPLHQPDKSAVAEHSRELHHRIKFKNTKVPAKTTGCMDRFVKEAIEIRLHSNNVNREEGYKLTL